ncbi:MAG: ankyrin repeat domain-containing protein [Armatimonadetes bacterium]|nr:ankyrin repeat domain-containing protein [Armatimonadota bacterium]
MSKESNSGHDESAIEEVERLLEVCGGLNEPDEDGSTPLHLAVKEEAVKLLLQEGADSGARDAKGCTPLHVARTVGIVRLLLDDGANPNALDDQANTPLHTILAAGTAHDYGGDEVALDPSNVHEWVIGVRSLQEPAPLVRLLMDSGADPTAKNVDGMTPLHYASSTDSVRMLLDGGADHNSQNKDGKAPLHYSDSAENARILLDAGASVSLLDHDGSTALDDQFHRFDYNYRCYHGKLLKQSVDLVSLLASVDEIKRPLSADFIIGIYRSRAQYGEGKDHHYNDQNVMCDAVLCSFINADIMPEGQYDKDVLAIIAVERPSVRRCLTRKGFMVRSTPLRNIRRTFRLGKCRAESYERMWPTSSGGGDDTAKKLAAVSFHAFWIVAFLILLGLSAAADFSYIMEDITELERNSTYTSVGNDGVLDISAIDIWKYRFEERGIASLLPRSPIVYVYFLAFYFALAAAYLLYEHNYIEFLYRGKILRRFYRRK